MRGHEDHEEREDAEEVQAVGVPCLVENQDVDEQHELNDGRVPVAQTGGEQKCSDREQPEGRVHPGTGQRPDELERPVRERELGLDEEPLHPRVRRVHESPYLPEHEDAERDPEVGEAGDVARREECVPDARPGPASRFVRGRRLSM